MHGYFYYLLSCLSGETGQTISTVVVKTKELLVTEAEKANNLEKRQKQLDNICTLAEIKNPMGRMISKVDKKRWDHFQDDRNQEYTHYQNEIIECMKTEKS